MSCAASAGGRLGLELRARSGLGGKAWFWGFLGGWFGWGWIGMDLLDGMGWWKKQAFWWTLIYCSLSIEVLTDGGSYNGDKKHLLNRPFAPALNVHLDI